MRSLRRLLRPLLAAALVAGVLASVALAVAAGLGLVTWVEAGTLVALALLAALACGLGLGLVLVRRSVRALEESVREHARTVSQALGEDRLETRRSLKDLRERVSRISDQALPKASRELRRAVEVQGRADYEQQVAWAELRDHLDTAAFMPPLRGWAASPDVLRVLVRHIERLRPETVVECGSGASSVWLGYALRRAGRGRLVALEHDARYAELSRALVASHGLDDIVEVRHAPFTPIGTDTVSVDGEERTTADRWYDRAALAGLAGVGLVFVDGPPQATGLQVRHPALPLLLPHCTEDAVFVLDDADRPEERAVGDRWLAAHPEFHRTEEQAEKGAHVFGRKGI
ncbi:class I SAM-dependent methyltransferase [Nocardiopsis flavescens]|uniref:Methyltransferase domain-containing protein n=1 Tax=Nocardiopsis flavescens TaxID=758803 RepID=A0A1M6E4Z4_9ACTN|nr:class I SAM-dependent methyltransferase [Nocardiopsis flavescens]SHI80483.1 Methyltransferase domain-containing protein [Nocardiopsis flavescens]